ncbi:MAG: hypothetical protein ABR915_12500 [Thermoguttaceae bacterium]|jgi:hypothetical protein
MNPAIPKSARDRSFVRKVVYVAAMGLLLMPLYWLSHPATRAVDPKGERGRAGGVLARLRKDYKLTQVDIGEIDPAIETIRLAALGMRGVATTLLWSKAERYKMKKDWTNLRAALEQISKLEPHSIGVWRFQAWNLSYNVSVAFDDYHDKYYWVMEGIKFMQRGAQYNEHEPRLVWDLGWFTSQKIGRADEAALYRKLFKEDDLYRSSLPPAMRGLGDNWLVGKAWFREAEDRVDDEHPIRGLSDVIFYSNAPMAQFYYGEAVEKDGDFGGVAARAWKQAADDWYDYGRREIPTSWDVNIRLNDQEMHEQAARRAAAELDKLAPGVRDKLAAEKRAKLTDAEKAACDAPPEKRTPEQARLAADAGPRLAVSNEEIARRVTGPARREALKLADEASHATEMADYVRRERSKVNFDYWRLRAEVEQDPETIAARKAIYEADQAFHRADLLTARAAYERGFKTWRTVLDRYPTFKEDSNTGYDLMQSIRDYRKLLKQLDETFPKPFILQDIIDKNDRRE